MGWLFDLVFKVSFNQHGELKGCYLARSIRRSIPNLCAIQSSIAMTVWSGQCVDAISSIAQMLRMPLSVSRGVDEG